MPRIAASNTSPNISRRSIDQRIVVVCGKGNNGGDGLAIARQLYTRFHPPELRVVLIADPAELRGDAALNFAMLHAPADCRSIAISVPKCAPRRSSSTPSSAPGMKGPAEGPALDAILEINRDFSPSPKSLRWIFHPDLSGRSSGAIPGEYVRAHATVTFTAPKVCHVMPPAANQMGDLRIAPIGSPTALYEDDSAIQLALITPASIASLFKPRDRDSNKGKYGHVLVVAGSRGKSGAAAMAGLAALRAGAGLVTVACPESALAGVASHSPEIMTEPLPESSQGVLSLAAFDRIVELAKNARCSPSGPASVPRMKRGRSCCACSQTSPGPWSSMPMP